MNLQCYRRQCRVVQPMARVNPSTGTLPTSVAGITATFALPTNRLNARISCICIPDTGLWNDIQFQQQAAPSAPLSTWFKTPLIVAQDPLGATQDITPAGQPNNDQILQPTDGFDGSGFPISTLLPDVFAIDGDMIRKWLFTMSYRISGFQASSSGFVALVADIEPGPNVVMSAEEFREWRPFCKFDGIASLVQMQHT